MASENTDHPSGLIAPLTNKTSSEAFHFVVGSLDEGRAISMEKHAVSSCPNSLARGCGKSKPVYVCKHQDVYSYTVYVNNNINMDQ